MHSIDLILLLASGFTLAVVCGYLTNRAGLSPIVGYLVAGLLVGPYTPGFVADQHLAEQLAEVGVILLMFGVGLQFHLDELLAVKKIAIRGALVQSTVATGLGVLVARFAGWPLSAGIVFGIALSVASTVVLARVLADNRHLHTRTGHIAVGWLVVEDLFTVLVLVLLPAVAGSGGSSLTVTVLLAVVKIAALAAFTITVGGRAIPWLLNRIVRTRSRELFTLTVLALALGIAVAAAKLFGALMALGAFLAGMVVGRSEFSVRAASEALPMRDAFAVLFFVSIGMLLDPQHLLRAPALIGLTLAVVLVGKPLAALAITTLLRQPLRVGLPVAVVLSQIGEFSFIVASPSGEKCGFVVCPWKLVSRRAFPPARPTSQMLFAYANAMWFALTAGDRRSRVGAPFGAALRTMASVGNTSQGIARRIARGWDNFITDPPKRTSCGTYVDSLNELTAFNHKGHKGH